MRRAAEERGGGLTDLQALERFRPKGHDRQYRKVPVSSRVDGEKLLRIVGDAIWSVTLAAGNEPRAVLEEVWKEMDTIKRNTSGCRLWKSNVRPAFPYREVCFSETPQTCTLGNTPGRVSRLELMEGLRRTLGLWVSWCHVDLLLREINTRVPRRAGQSKECIAKETFIAAMWPFVAPHAFRHSLSCPNNRVTVASIPQALGATRPRAPGAESGVAALSRESSRISAVDSADL